MRRFSLVLNIVFLTIGLLVGAVVMSLRVPPSPPTKPLPSPTQSEQGDAAATEPLQLPRFSAQEDDNFLLLTTAYHAATLLRDRDFVGLANYVHPDLGLRFTPYSTVEEENRTFTRSEVANMGGDENEYTWGFVDGRGSPIQLSVEDYLARYVYDADYCNAPQIGINEILHAGNALDNITEVYPNAQFVDFCYAGLDEEMEGMDWCSLRLVFETIDNALYLRCVVHGEWTV